MKPLLLLFAVIFCAGCAVRPAPSSSLAAARASGEAAQARVAAARVKAAALKARVATELVPDVEAMEQDLQEANAQLDFLKPAHEAAERELRIVAQQRDAFMHERDAALTSRNRWRTIGIWAGALLILIALFVFRKPLMRLAGVPV